MLVRIRCVGRRPLIRLSVVAALLAIASGALVLHGGTPPQGDPVEEWEGSLVRTVSVTPRDRIELAMADDYLPALSEAFAARASIEAVEPPPPPESEPTSEPSTASQAGAATGTPKGVWDTLAQCESGQNWSINTGNGFYGGLQFTLESWRWVGGTGYPHEASRETQIAMAERLLDRQGWIAWPACSAKLGLR